MFQNSQPLALYMQSSLNSEYAKMGYGIMRYGSHPITCVIDTTYAGKSVREATGHPFKIPIVATVEEARSMGAEILVLGVAPSGGRLPKAWIPSIETGLRLGMSLINGMHDLMAPKFSHLLDSNNPNQKIWDTRKPAFIPAIGSAKAAQLENKRVLMIGTDMAVGKMTTGLELYRWAKKQGVSAGFIATGQVGITITGKGIPLDAFIVDRACGAVETMVMNEQDKDIVFVEGQGSLANPGSTATLPLMRGTCPTHLVLCHIARMDQLHHAPHIKTPPMREFIQLNEALCRVCGSLPAAKTIGISLNTYGLPEEAALSEINRLELQTGLPVTDVVRYGPAKLGQLLLHSSPGI